TRDADAVARARRHAVAIGPGRAADRVALRVLDQDPGASVAAALRARWARAHVVSRDAIACTSDEHDAGAGETVYREPAQRARTGRDREAGSARDVGPVQLDDRQRRPLRQRLAVYHHGIRDGGQRCSE